MRIEKTLTVLLLGLTVACVTSPLGRKQLMLVPDSQMDQMGAQAFDQLKQTTPADKDPATNKYVQCIVDALAPVTSPQTNVSKWDVVVFKDKQVNAFALPGGRIGVYDGILSVAKTDAQLAAVLAHETGHVIAKHGGERVSQQAGTQLGLAALGAISPNNPKSQMLLGLLGVGAQVGILLPFGRTQETEADVIGIHDMAKAGFDPRHSVELWKNMMAASGGGGPPEFLSTHPANQTRIDALQAQMPQALQEYEAAKAAGRKPVCPRPDFK